MKITKFSDIPQFTRDGNYRVNMPFSDVERTIARWQEGRQLDMDPDFQREHVWTETQQIRYLEFRFRGGKSGRDILWNSPGFKSGSLEPMVLVDGKQRIQALLRFLHNEIPVFGSLYSEYTDKLHHMQHDFIFVVNDLKTRKEVLQWYIDLNAGGTPHTDDEINKVQELLKTT